MWSAGVDYQQQNGWYRPKPSGGGGSFSITALTPQTIAKNNTPTFANVTPGTNNCVLFGINYGPPGTAVTITSLSLNGVAGTQVSGAFADNSGQGACSDMWNVVGAGSGSGALVINFSGVLNNGIFVQPWAIVTSTTTPSGGAMYDFGIAGPTATVNTLAIPSGGGMLGICGAFDTNVLTFSGLTQDNAPTWAGQFVTVNGVSGHTTSGGGTTPTITCTAAGGASETWAMSVVAFAP